MKVFNHYADLRESKKGRVVTIGNFDGVHCGHRAVLDAARRDANQRNLDLAVFTFEPHPAQHLRKDVPPLRLVEPARKLELLEGCGVDVVLAQRFDREFASLEPSVFAEEVLAQSLGAKLVVVGDNFRFGASRAGDVGTLHRLGTNHSFEVSAKNMVTCEGEGVSSSRVRRLIQEGRVSDAAELLERPHEIPGRVIHGRGEGKGLGFPTVNLSAIQVLVPAPGIYAAWCEHGDGTEKAAVYVGNRPTLGHGETVEAHLMDFVGDLYDKRVVLRLVDRLRTEQKFDSVDDLKAQMARDVIGARELLEKGHA